jgi:hypothetical protein
MARLPSVFASHCALLWARLRMSLRAAGITSAVAYPARHIAWLIRYYRRERRDGFDRDLGIETRHPIDVTATMRAIGDTNPGWYEPAPVETVTKALQLLNIEYANYALIDLGSGKGRILFLAAPYPFRRIIGIEADLSCHLAAERNLSILTRRDFSVYGRIELCNGDASTFNFPAGDIVVMLSNAFCGAILDRVLALVHARPRPTIVYVVSLWTATEVLNVFARWPIFQRISDNAAAGIVIFRAAY